MPQWQAYAHPSPQLPTQDAAHVACTTSTRTAASAPHSCPPHTPRIVGRRTQHPTRRTRRSCGGPLPSCSSYTHTATRRPAARGRSTAPRAIDTPHPRLRPTPRVALPRHTSHKHSAPALHPQSYHHRPDTLHTHTPPPLGGHAQVHTQCDGASSPCTHHTHTATRRPHTLASIRVGRP